MPIILRPNELKVIHVDSHNMSLKGQMEVSEKLEKEFLETHKNASLMVLFNIV